MPIGRPLGHGGDKRVMLIKEWFAEWAQAFYIRRGYDPVNRAINVFGVLLVLGVLGAIASDAFS